MQRAGQPALRRRSYVRNTRCAFRSAPALVRARRFLVTIGILQLAGCGSRTAPAEVVAESCAATAPPDVTLTLGAHGHGHGDWYSSTEPRWCPGEYVVDIALGSLSGLYASGVWGPIPLGSECNYAARATLYGRAPGSLDWELVDRVETHSELESGICTYVLTSRLAQLPAGADASTPHGYVPPGRYEVARIAVRAVDGKGESVPAFIDYFYPTP